MVRRAWAVLLLVGLLVMPAAVGAQDDAACDAVLFLNAWTRATAPGAPNGAVFGLVANLGAEPDRLVGGHSDAAEVVEIHTVVMGDNDVMQMMPVEGGLEIPPGGFQTLAPGGLHVMLIGLTAPLVEGERLDLVLTFERAGDVAVSVPIEAIDAEALSMPMLGMHGAPMATPEPAALSPACAGLHLLDGWVRPAGPGMPNTAAYGLLYNGTDAPVTLTGGSTDVATVVEVHEMVMGDNDVMQMRPIEGGLRLPPGHAALLRPGGLHLMVIGLNRELPVGATVDLAIDLADGDPVSLALPVREPPQSSMPAQGMSGGHMAPTDATEAPPMHGMSGGHMAPEATEAASMGS